MPEDPQDLTAEEEELVVTSQQLVEALQREALEKGIEQGIKQGFEQGTANALSHLFERRLRRQLGEDERARLRERIEILGPDRVTDIVLDQSADELARWLADPQAH